MPQLPIRASLPDPSASAGRLRGNMPFAPTAPGQPAVVTHRQLGP
jgi:hypothetical protein